MKAPAFQLYAQDFDMDTATWENDEIGAYLRLLLYEWVNGGLPNDTYKLSKIARESERKFKEKWKNLSQKFTLNGNGLLINKRMEITRQIQLNYSESRRKNVSVRYKDRPTHEPTYEEHMNLHSTYSSSSSSKEKKYIKKRMMKIPDEEWLLELQNKECYSHLKIREQLQKCQTWFENKGIIVSRQRFLNWLNNPRNNPSPIEVKNDKSW